MLIPSQKISRILSPLLLGCILFIPALAEDAVPVSSAPPVAPASMDNPLPGDVPGAAEPVGSPKRAVSAKGKSRGEVGGKKSRKRDVGKRQNGKRSVGKAAQRKTGYSKAAAAKHKSGGKAKSNKPLKKRKK